MMVLSRNRYNGFPSKIRMAHNLSKGYVSFLCTNLQNKHDERGGEADVINWQEIRIEYESTTCTMKSLAEKYDISPSTLRSRKNRESWQRNATKNVATQSEIVATDKKGGQLNNKNAKNNSGGSAPKGNKNAVTHGLFAKWLPEETAEIMESIQNRSEADMLWDSIMFQYTAIIRAQKIMFVDDKHDLSNETSGYSSGEGGSGETYAVQYAWDKHASFMNAQSRALNTLANLIKQFVAIADEADERRLRLEMMRSQIQAIHAKLDESEQEVEDDGFLAALESEGDNLWQEEQ